MQSRLNHVIDQLAPQYETRNQARDSIIAQKGEDAWFNNPEPKQDYAALRKELEEEEAELYKAIERLENLESLASDPSQEAQVARSFFNEQAANLRGPPGGRPISEVRLLGKFFNDWQNGRDGPKLAFFRVLYQLSDRGSLCVCRVIQNTTLEWAEHGSAFPPVSVPSVARDSGGGGRGGFDGGRGGSGGRGGRGGGGGREGFDGGRGGGGGRGGSVESRDASLESRGGKGGLGSQLQSVQDSRQPLPLPTVLLVDTISTCRQAVAEISQHRLVSVDLEGVQLCRSGEICILQVALPNNRVFLFDICSLRADAFEAGGLREMLSRPSPLKLMYDCRADADALFHQYRVRLDGVYDLQVAVVKTKMNLAQKLPGLAVCISRCCGDTSPEAISFKAAKERGAGLCHFRHVF